MRLGVAGAVVDGAVLAGDVEILDGRVSAVGCAPAGRAGTAVPGFVDLQVNGFAGVDFAIADLAGYRRASEALARTGVTSFLATIPTSAAAQYVPALGVAAEAARPGALPGARVVGVHLEGPFLAPARRGVHREDWLEAPAVVLADRLLAAGPVRWMTLAPELPGAVELIGHLVRGGVVVALGHSDADAASAHRGFDAGASAVTHLWNAMAPVSARSPGLAGVALSRPDVAVCVIADLVHVAPETLLLSLAAAGDRAIVVTDSVAVTGPAEGPQRAGRWELSVSDGAARTPDGTLAGSAVGMDQALRNLVSLGVPLGRAVQLVATAPAAALGRPDLGRLVPGARADLVVLDEGLTVERVLIESRAV